MPRTPFFRLFRPARLLRPVPWLLAALLWVSPAVHADHLLTLRKTSDGPQMTGSRQGPTEHSVRVWLGDRRVRRDDGHTTTILRLDRSVLYIVDHRREVFHALELPIDLSEFLPTGMDGVYNSLHFKGKASASDQRASVGPWKARRYDLRLASEMGMTMDVELWLSPDPPVDAALYRRLVSVLASVQPGGDWTAHLRGAPGFPVRQASVIEALGGKTHVKEELRSVTEGRPPAGAYDPPAGYVEERYDPLDELGAKKERKKTPRTAAREPAAPTSPTTAKPTAGADTAEPKPKPKTREPTAKTDKTKSAAPVEVENVEVVIEKGKEPEKPAEPPKPASEERG